MANNATKLNRIILYCDKIEKAMEYFADEDVEIRDNEFFQDISSFYISQIGESVGKLSTKHYCVVERHNGICAGAE
jgi:hypothetical protein